MFKFTNYIKTNTRLLPAELRDELLKFNFGHEKRRKGALPADLSNIASRALSPKKFEEVASLYETKACVNRAPAFRAVSH